MTRMETGSEADLPAQRAEAGQAPRLPRPHVDPGRPGGPALPAAEGPRPPVGLIWRLRGRRPHRRGQPHRPVRRRAGVIRLRFLPGVADQPPSVAYAVGRAVGAGGGPQPGPPPAPGRSSPRPPPTARWPPAPYLVAARPARRRAHLRRARPRPAGRPGRAREPSRDPPVSTPSAPGAGALSARRSAATRRPPRPAVALPLRAELLGLRPRGGRDPRRRPGLAARPAPPRPLPPLGRPRLGPCPGPAPRPRPPTPLLPHGRPPDVRRHRHRPGLVLRPDRQLRPGDHAPDPRRS